MKKIFFLSTISAVILMTSCNKQLNQVPISTPTTATFYKTPSDFLQASNAIYGDLHNYPVRLANLSEIRSDNIYGVSVTVRDWDPVNDFSPSLAANAYVTEAWGTDFNGIFRANTLLEQIAKNGSNIGSATLAARLQAEAKFLRAFYYFDLVRYFGQLPIIDHVVSGQEANTIGRSPVADVYKLIIADLQSAVANLPTVYSAGDVGRATKYAAEALLAQVYMARSGPDYGIKGPGLGANEWNLALPLLQDIINSNQFTFNSSYSNIFSYNNQNPAVNKEAVFDVMYTSGISGTSDLYGASFPWTLAPSGYFLSIGGKTSNGSLEIIPVSNDLANSYETGDVRKDFSLYTAGYTNAGSTENRPFFKKWLDVTKTPVASRFDWGINFIAIRYTDILMLKAECILHGATGSQSDVDAIVNQVRTRAGLAPVSGVTLPQLFSERRREFANEGSRWFDLQRSGDLINVMNSWIAKEDAQKSIKPVVANYVIYPVPQSQLDTTPGLYSQNPGY
ncbi:RagB/SusD family nutrient uptake outer membrane protein [Mucilaginibacter pocheonensis]|uniref:Starch-binding associating with outer membrane n=1 Tax=Mucilaginibacter pocheonensis TaxID=398050 RepID=A0ABU1TCE4_9SPHI|nr:RagB/SusD family nutrient uptake outer membrane protein [Mucilaginibacter pocheonensis]MDR6942989.1 hypothetical protein [Mucilaginibacter pocheonensis]